ncbi:MAG: Fic family protein [Clostridia bacterium]|nr:Fic family protein [Clostridia bacterium]
MYQDPFKEYIKQSEPNKRDKGYAWSTAIGLQAVDGLEPSEHLVKTAIENIEGYITMEDAERRINSYYETISKKEEDDRTEEDDKVSVRIASILSEKAFTFSPSEYIGIHKKLFWGIYKHAGKIRDVNITKKEWVLDGETVLYGNATELRQTLEYDFEQEKKFSYKGLSQDEIIEHLAYFISRLWQIHIFGEGNTRTTAVFFIKYLRSLGYDATNDIFAENSWYFRNALVRANYTNLKKNIYETTIYLEKFIRNLLLGEKNELKNRYLNINNLFEENVGVNSKSVGVKEIDVGVKLNKTQTKIVELMKNNLNITSGEMAKYVGVETRTIERNIKTLKEKGIIDRVGADKNGHWIVKI